MHYLQCVLMVCLSAELFSCLPVSINAVKCLICCSLGLLFCWIRLFMTMNMLLYIFVCVSLFVCIDQSLTLWEQL